MSQQLGRGLGALLSDTSKPTLDSSDRYRAIREKEKELEELQEQIGSESKTLEELRKKLTIELMLNGKVDKTELFQMEEKLNVKIKKKDVLLKEINTLKEEVRSYVNVAGKQRDQSGETGPTDQIPADDLTHEIDIRLIKELMPSTDEVPDAEPHDDEKHIQGLRDELDRSKQVEVMRREAYGDEQQPALPPPQSGGFEKKKVRRIVSPKRVRVVRGTARPISKRRDEQMYEKVESALQRMNVGDIQGAKAALEEILSEYPNDDEVLYHLGNCYFIDNDLENAENYFRKVLEKNPRSYRALNNLGIVLQKTGNKEAAIRAFNQSLEIEQDYERAWLNLGSIFMTLDPPMMREASIFLRRAIELQPSLKVARDKLEVCKAALEGT